MSMSWEQAVASFTRLLGDIRFTDGQGDTVAVEHGFRRWTEATVDVREKRRTVYLVGNGASASMASHFAADLAKNAHVHTQVFTDLSLITAISNDIGYHEVYAEPLGRRAITGDMLVAISSSGRSPNILRAVEVAREHGLLIVTLSSMSDDNPLRSLGDLNVYLNAQTYGQAETGHAAVLHHWMDSMSVA
jgi:D-sedoheptulose 7-phosphate isomerase